MSARKGRFWPTFGEKITDMKKRKNKLSKIRKTKNQKMQKMIKNIKNQKKKSKSFSSIKKNENIFLKKKTDLKD